MTSTHGGENVLAIILSSTLVYMEGGDSEEKKFEIQILIHLFRLQTNRDAVCQS